MDGMGARNAFRRVSPFVLGLQSKWAHQVDQAAVWNVCDLRD